MKKLTYVGFLLALLIGLPGCSTPTSHFDDTEIRIRLINSQANDQFRSYGFEIENHGDVTVEHINFYMSFPIKQGSGAKGNPFKIEARTEINQPIVLKPDQKVNFTVFAPIKEVFGDSNLLDFEHPSIELKGYVREKGFSMSGGLDVFANQTNGGTGRITLDTSNK